MVHFPSNLIGINPKIKVVWQTQLLLSSIVNICCRIAYQCICTIIYFCQNKCFTLSMKRHQSFLNSVSRSKIDGYSHHRERVFLIALLVEADWCRLIVAFFLQTEDKCRNGWLNPGPALGRVWGGFSECEGLGAGDPVYFPSWSLLGKGLNNKALFTELPRVPCVQTQALPPHTSAVLTRLTATGFTSQPTQLLSCSCLKVSPHSAAAIQTLVSSQFGL